MKHRLRPLAVSVLVTFVTSLVVPASVAGQQPFTFTDSTITATSTAVKTAHITELRSAVNTMRGLAGLASSTFTDASLSGVAIKRVHITELRTALDAVYDAVGQARPTYTDATITAGSTAIRRLHIVELRSAVNNVVIPAGFSISSLGTTSATPSQLLTITGSGFDTASDMRVVFTDANNRAVVVPAMDVTATSLRVTVPPVLNSSGVMASGTLSVTVRKISGGTTTNTNTVSGLQVSNVPTTPLAAGSVMKALLSATRSQDLALRNEPVAAAVKTQLDKAFTNNGHLLAKVQSVIDNPSATFTLGSINGQTITIGATDLAALDRVLLSMLAAMGSQPASKPDMPAADNDCMKAEAAEAAAAGGQSNYELFSPGIAQVLAANRQAGKCGTPQAVKQGLDFVLGVGGVAAAGIAAGCALVVTCPASVLAMSGAALLYITVVGIGGQIGLGGALNQTTAAAGQFVQNGLDSLEQELQELAAGAVKLGDILSFYNDVKDFHNATTTNTLPPYTPPANQTVTGITITQTGTTTTAVITPALSGRSVTYSLIGTDGYYLSGTLTTNASGAISFGVAPACGGVRDTVTVNVAGGPSASAVHVWGNACRGVAPRVPPPQ